MGAQSVKRLAIGDELLVVSLLTSRGRSFTNQGTSGAITRSLFRVNSRERELGLYAADLRTEGSALGPEMLSLICPFLL